MSIRNEQCKATCRCPRCRCNRRDRCVGRCGECCNGSLSIWRRDCCRFRYQAWRYNRTPMVRFRRLQRGLQHVCGDAIYLGNAELRWSKCALHTGRYSCAIRSWRSNFDSKRGNVQIDRLVVQHVRRAVVRSRVAEILGDVGLLHDFNSIVVEK